MSSSARAGRRVNGRKSPYWKTTSSIVACRRQSRSLSHLSGDYGAWFKDPLLVAAYPSRPAYPAALIDHLTALIAGERRVVLDVGCGTGESWRAG